MGNTNCNNAVPCLGSEPTNGNSPRLNKSGKKGVTAKNRRGSQTDNRRTIDSFLFEQREQGNSVKSLRSTERMLNYGLYQVQDETGMPQHYLLDTVGNTSSNSGSGSGADGSMRRGVGSNFLYASQRTSLFEEFVDQTLTNFSQSEFDKSISLIEFTIQSQIFTRKHPTEKKKSSRFSISKKSRPEPELPDPIVHYSISIGDVLMCKWTGEEDNWDSKTNDPEQFPYHQDTLAAAEAAQQQNNSQRKTPRKASPKEATLPDVVTKRLCIPFEFRFTNQDLQLEIRDSTDNCLLYEVQIPFEQLLSEPQLLQEPTIILASSDSRHLVRLSVRELEESQKMLCRVNLRDQSDFRGQSSESSALLVGNDDKVDLWAAKIEVFEMIRPLNGNSYRMRCIHYIEELEQIQGAIQVPLVILVPHYEVGFFQQRLFQIEFDKKMYMEVTGQDLMKLSENGTIHKQLLKIPQQQQLDTDFTPRKHLSERQSRAQITEEIKDSILSMPRTEEPNNPEYELQLRASSGMPDVDLTLDTGALSETPSEEVKHQSQSVTVDPEKHQSFQICAPIKIERPLSVVGLIQSGDLRVVPMIGIDFSLGNLTFEDNTVLHSTNPSKPNDYRSLLRMLSHAYRNVLNLPIFGYGSKTSTFSNKTCQLFPLSRSIRNPFTPNDENSIDQTYSDCLSTLELSVPVNVTPMITFFRKLGEHQEKRLKRKAAHQQAIKGTFDTFYVLYILSTGIIDDVQELIRELRTREWKRMPLQIHLISLAPNHLQESDQDTQSLCDEVNKLNIEAGWPQFQIHFFDRIKKQVRGKGQKALLRLKQDCILRVPRDIESCIFANGYDLAKYKHNQNLTNATQSQQYIMDLIDQKFEKLKDSVYKLGISPIQFRNMVEGQALYEWSPEVALALSTRFCSWVVAETNEEHNLEETEESKSLLIGRRRARQHSVLQIRDRNNSQYSARRASQSGGNMQTPRDGQERTNPSNEQDNDVGDTKQQASPDPSAVWKPTTPLKQVTEEASSPHFTASPVTTFAAEESKQQKVGQGDAYPEEVRTEITHDNTEVSNQTQKHRLGEPEERDNPEVIVPLQAQEEASNFKSHQQ